MAASTHMQTLLTQGSSTCKALTSARSVTPLVENGVRRAAALGQRCSRASALKSVLPCGCRSGRPSRSQNFRGLVLLNSSDRDSDLVDSLRDDMERMQSKQANANKNSTAGGRLPQAKEPSDGILDRLKQTVDKVLIADFFFVLAALAWLAAGVAEKSTVNSTKLLDAWYPLWMLVFQPAIGVLMLGALVSGATGWLKNKSSA